MRKRMMSVLLCTVLAVSLAAPAFAAYRDVPASHWAAGDIQYVTERGLFNGTSPDTFGPSTEMSRAMLATVLHRYAGSPAVSGSAPYVDVTVGAWYMPGVIWAYQNGVFPSVNLSRTLLYPDENVRRAEFCVMLYNFAKSLGKANDDPSVITQAPFTDMAWDRFPMAGFGPPVQRGGSGHTGLGLAHGDHGRHVGHHHQSSGHHHPGGSGRHAGPL